MDYKKIGQNIKKYRVKKGFTQNALAQEIGKSESSIRKYEKGLVEIPNSVLEEIAEKLTIPPSLLMPEDDLIKQICELPATSPSYGLNHLIKEITEPFIIEYLKNKQPIHDEQIVDDDSSIEVQDLTKKTHSIPKEALEILKQAQESLLENAGTIAQQGKDILEAINKLNEEGQQKVKAYAEDLAENPKYQKDQTEE